MDDSATVSQPNYWFDGSSFSAALQLRYPWCFEHFDNRDGAGGMFGPSVGPDIRMHNGQLVFDENHFLFPMTVADSSFSSYESTYVPIVNSRDVSSQ